MHALVELSRLISESPGLSILDIGCIGPSPLDFWRPLFALYGGQFTLTGIDPDAAGVERTKTRLAEFAPQSITLLPGSGYDLARLFPGQLFDVIVFTQVLEHVFRYRAFLQQVAAVCRPGGHSLFTLDSGHYPHGRLIKDTVKELLARLGQESYYEHGWRDDQLDPALAELGFEVLSRGYYCTTPGKKLHNRYVPDARKNDFMRLWYAQETFINQHVP